MQKTTHMEHAEFDQLEGSERIMGFAESLITKSYYCQWQRLLKANDPWFSACLLSTTSSLLRSILFKVLQDVTSAPLNPVRQIPAFLKDARAVGNAIQELTSYIKDTMVLCDQMTRSSQSLFLGGDKPASTSASEWRILREYLSRQVYNHICLFLENAICCDMYILSYIWQHDSTLHKQNKYIINSWYKSHLCRLERSQWVVVSEDEEMTLLHHSLLPHPHHFVKVRKETTPAENTWASIFKLPQSEGSESLLLFCGFKNNTRLPPVQDCVVRKEALPSTEHLERKGVHFDDYDAFLSKAMTSEIDKLLDSGGVSTSSTGGGGHLKGRTKRATKTRNDYFRAHMEKMLKISCLCDEEDGKEWESESEDYVW